MWVHHKKFSVISVSANWNMISQIQKVPEFSFPTKTWPKDFIYCICSPSFLVTLISFSPPSPLAYQNCRLWVTFGFCLCYSTKPCERGCYFQFGTPQFKRDDGSLEKNGVWWWGEGRKWKKRLCLAWGKGRKMLGRHLSDVSDKEYIAIGLPMKCYD